MSETTITFENVMDALGAIIDPLPTARALHVLTAGIMRTVNECENPDIALLAVIAELTQLVRFATADDTVPTLEDWIEDAWQEG